MSDRQIIPIYMVKLKTIHRTLICNDRWVIEELGTIFSNFLKTFYPLKAPNAKKNLKNQNFSLKCKMCPLIIQIHKTFLYFLWLHYKRFIRHFRTKFTWSSIVKNVLQVDFSNKFSKKWISSIERFGAFWGL